MFHLNQVHATQHCGVLKLSGNGLALYGNSINNHHPITCSYQNHNTVGDSVREQVKKAIIL
jgi:hypothetical protein